MKDELRYKYNSIILYLPLISLLWDMSMIVSIMTLCILGLDKVWSLILLTVYSVVKLPICFYYKYRR